MRTKDQAERERGIGRRQLLQGLGIGAMAAGSGLPHRGYAMGGKAAADFTHGVASGDPLQDRVILWSRVLPHRAIDLLTVFWQVAQDAAFNQVVAAGESKAQAAQDYTVKVDAIGLQPGQDYFYRFTALGGCQRYRSYQNPAGWRRGRISPWSCVLLELSPRLFQRLPAYGRQRFGSGTALGRLPVRVSRR